MVTRNYLLAKPAPRSFVRRLFDQSVIPALINISGDIESNLQRLALRAQTSPRASVIGAFGLGLVLTTLRPRRS